MPATLALTQYYGRRAQEYDKVYAKPERQGDLALLHRLVPELMIGRRVYEVACGTGYWTALVAQSAQTIFATDINDEVLEIARTRPMPPHRVTFAQADAFALPSAPEPCTAGFAGFWWSHLRRGDELDQFLRGFFARLKPGARFVFLDNANVIGSSTAIARTDADGNTFQVRTLADRSTHEVLKNFPDEDEVRAVLEPYAARVTWDRLSYYWLVWGELK